MEYNLLYQDLLLDTDPELYDMPALTCFRSNKIKSLGGPGWEQNNPSINIGMCICETRNTEKKELPITKKNAG